MNRGQCCRLCMSTLDPTNIDNYLNIFSVIGIEMKMNEIISEHFKCEISELDSLPNYVCQTCWDIVNKFHELYENSKTVQEKFQNPPIKVEPELWQSNQEPEFVEELELGPVKPESNLVGEPDSADVDLDTNDNQSNDDNDQMDYTNNTYDSDENSENEEVDKEKSTDKKSNKKDSTKKSSEKPAPPAKKKRKSRKAMRMSRVERDKQFDEFLNKHRDRLKMDCDSCPTIFKTLREARKHYAQKHNNPNGYIKCCSAKLNYPSQVVDHVKKHVEPKQQLKTKTRREKIATCDLCTKSFTSKFSLRIHMKRHVDELVETENGVQLKFIQENFDLKCDFCDTVFGGFYDARRHYSSFHNDDKGYLKCCKMKLRELWMVKDHIRSHLEPECFKCDSCGKSFTTRLWLVKHKRRHKLTMEKSFICDYCGRRCRDKEQILRHMFTKHGFVEAKYECKICNKKFQLPLLLRTHLYSTHREKKAIATCDICGKSFFSNFHLRKHKLQHVDKSERLFESKQCAHCGEWIMTKSGVFYHQQIHTSGVHKCEQCEMEFPNRVAYLTHIRHYHREHKFKCSFCGKTFPIASTLKKHEESHTRHRVYQCKFCDKTFTVASSRSTHMGRDHREERDRLREMSKLKAVLAENKDQS